MCWPFRARRELRTNNQPDASNMQSLRSPEHWFPFDCDYVRIVRFVKSSQIWRSSAVSTCPSKPFLRNLKCPGPKQEIDNVALVRLEPVEFGRRDRADVQTVDVRRVRQLAL